MEYVFVTKFLIRLLAQVHLIDRTFGERNWMNPYDFTNLTRNNWRNLFFALWWNEKTVINQELISTFKCLTDHWPNISLKKFFRDMCINTYLYCIKWNSQLLKCFSDPMSEYDLSSTLTYSIVNKTKDLFKLQDD